MNTLNPVWIQKISIAYEFQIVQPLVFRVFDVDTKYHNTPVKMLNLNQQETLGEATCALSEVHACEFLKLEGLNHYYETMFCSMLLVYFIRRIHYYNVFYN